MKDPFLKKITKLNIIHMLISLVFMINVILFLTGIYTDKYIIPKRYSCIILILSCIGMGFLKIKVLKLKYKRLLNMEKEEEL